MRPTDYDDIADQYAARIDDRVWNTLYERPNTLALLPPVGGKDILDAGCGPGWYAERLVGRGARVVGVDRSARLIELARERLGDRARFHCADVSDMRGTVPDSSADIVVASLVLHYIADLRAAFAECARVLRVGGTLVFSTVHPVAEPGRHGGPYLQTTLVEEHWPWLGTMHFYRRPLSEITEPLVGAGFVIDRICEPMPSEELRAKDPTGYERLRRNPAFIFVRARKDELRASR